MSEDPNIPDAMGKIVAASVVGIILLAGATVAAYRNAAMRPGTIILPGGVTYLGPPEEKEIQQQHEEPKPVQEVTSSSPTPTQPPPTQPVPTRFTADATVPWKTLTGKAYPYSFQYPQTLILSLFSSETNEGVGFPWGATPANQNILLNIDKPADNPAAVQYATVSTQDYVENWWRQFSGLKGSKSAQRFTNSRGLTGYRVSYVNLSGETPNVDVFYEAPGRGDIFIHLANGFLDPGLFDRIVDSVAWKSPTPVPSR